MLSPLSTPSNSPSTPPPILDEIDSDLVFRLGYFQRPDSLLIRCHSRFHLLSFALPPAVIRASTR